MRTAWVVLLALVGLFIGMGWILHRDDGLVRAVVSSTAEHDVLASARVRAVDLQGLDSILGSHPFVTVQWQGAWSVPSTALYDLAIEGPGRSTWRIDGHLVDEVAGPDDSGIRRIVQLAAGFHRIDIVREQDGSASRFTVTAARTGRPMEPLNEAALKPRLPRHPNLSRAVGVLYQVLGWLCLVALVVAIRRTLPALARQWRIRLADAGIQDDRRAKTRARLGNALAWAALALILSYGAALRLDAITARYGPVASPRWLSALQTRTVAPADAIRPATFTWEAAPLFPHQDGPPTHYMSDPYVYLKAGREMRSFYAAHFREPVFPFATKIFLRLLDGQDVAVSFASATFSVLAIWFTYLLGAAVWSRPVGLAAALGLALDYDAISLASLGWRDDAFVAAVALCAYVTLRCWRSWAQAPRVIRLGRLRLDAAQLEAIALGVTAGVAILVRIMALSFVVPGLVFLLLFARTGWRRRLALTGVAAVTAAVLAGPYFVNCWRVYGDPLYSFNVHGNVYRIAEGQQESSQGTVAYVIGKASSRPFDMLDTVAQGLTGYPFENKWHGLDRWRAGLGDWASMAAIAGLVLLAATPPGRLALFVLLMSLGPFSLTWKVDSNWRFTAHAYPFLLIAAAVAVSGVAWCVGAVFVPRRPGETRAPGRPRFFEGTAVVALALLGYWFVARVSPSLVFSETLWMREDAMLTAGSRDGAFFGSGWSEVAGTGNVRMRVATGEAVLSIPLPSVDDYSMTLRMDPFPRPLRDLPERLPVLEVVLNGTSISTVPLRWNPDRIGAYDVSLPRTSLRRGDNRLILRVLPAPAAADSTVRPGQPGLTDGDGIGLWYVRVHPAAAQPALKKANAADSWRDRAGDDPPPALSHDERPF